MSSETFDQLMTSLDPAMAVVTTVAGGEQSGCLVGFHGQSSIEPRRYGVWLSKANHTYGVALEAVDVAVHFLTDDPGDRELARIFGELTGDTTDKFALVPHRFGPADVPILTASRHGLVGRRVGLLDDGGDHVLLTIEPVETWSTGPFTPLRLSNVSDLTPAHEADEQP